MINLEYYIKNGKWFSASYLPTPNVELILELDDDEYAIGIRDNHVVDRSIYNYRCITTGDLVLPERWCYR